MKAGSALSFVLPGDRVAYAPAEARGSARDGVRLMVARPAAITHATFADLTDFLGRGDLLVVNDSPTMAAALRGKRRTGSDIGVHLSVALDDGSWVIELRHPDRSGPVLDGIAGEVIDLVGRASVTLLSPLAESKRLWRARVRTPQSLGRYLGSFGVPIRYAYVDDPWPLEAYQTVFAARRRSGLGSAEMPSAARPFTHRLLRRVRSAGVGVVPVTLDTGVSSLEAGESPYPERFRVSARAARAVNRARGEGRRVVAVGTTVTRALESAADSGGTVAAAKGWTDLILGPSRPARVVDGIITGWHSPDGSHLDLLEAVAGVELVESAYRAAVAGDYLWHEFGDSCLLLPGDEKGLDS